MFFVITDYNKSHYTIQFFTRQIEADDYVKRNEEIEDMNIVHSGECKDYTEITLYHVDNSGMVDIYDGEKTREYREGKNE